MKVNQTPDIIDRDHPDYPTLLAERLGQEVPDRLWAIGRLDLVGLAKTAFFCSARCPGDAILAAMDQAQRWRVVEHSHRYDGHHRVGDLLHGEAGDARERDRSEREDPSRLDGGTIFFHCNKDYPVAK